MKWERDGSPVEWDSNMEGALRVSRVEPSLAGSYTCTVTGPHGEIARRELQLVVSSKLNFIYLQLHFYPSTADLILLEEKRKYLLSFSIWTVKSTSYC